MIIWKVHYHMFFLDYLKKVLKNYHGKITFILCIRRQVRTSEIDQSTTADLLSGPSSTLRQ